MLGTFICIVMLTKDLNEAGIDISIAQVRKQLGKAKYSVEITKLLCGRAKVLRSP